MNVRLRLLKVMVQPVFVVDDGETMEEISIPPQPVPAKDWETYATGAFLVLLEQVRKQVEGDDQP